VWNQIDYSQNPEGVTFNIVTQLLGKVSNNLCEKVSKLSNGFTILEIMDVFSKAVTFKEDDILKAEVFKYTNEVMDITPVYLLKLSVERDGINIAEKNIWIEEWDHERDTSNTYNILMLWQSPVVPWITAPDGSHVGFNPQSGDVTMEFPVYMSERGSEPFYLFIPETSDKEYLIDVIGTGTGPYTFSIEVTNSEGIPSQGCTYTGQTTLGKIDTFKATLSESGDIVILPANQPNPVPEFPSTLLPATMIIGFLGAVLIIQRTREN
jgi:hypothetical protein